MIEPTHNIKSRCSSLSHTKIISVGTTPDKLIFDKLNQEERLPQLPTIRKNQGIELPNIRSSNQNTDLSTTNLQTQFKDSITENSKMIRASNSIRNSSQPSAERRETKSSMKRSSFKGDQLDDFSRKSMNSGDVAKHDLLQPISTVPSLPKIKQNNVAVQSSNGDASLASKILGSPAGKPNKEET